jgi:hypothetical protein
MNRQELLVWSPGWNKKPIQIRPAAKNSHKYTIFAAEKESRHHSFFVNEKNYHCH